jgi:hypothetical protein
MCTAAAADGIACSAIKTFMGHTWHGAQTLLAPTPATAQAEPGNTQRTPSGGAFGIRLVVCMGSHSLPMQ